MNPFMSRVNVHSYSGLKKKKKKPQSIPEKCMFLLLVGPPCLFPPSLKRS